MAGTLTIQHVPYTAPVAHDADFLPWHSRWTAVPTNAAPAAGGQGHVIRVRDGHGGPDGALKQLHDTHLNVTERRFRMFQEAQALDALGAQGTPALLDHNANTWRSKGHPMYVVMEWIDGETLAQRVQRRRLDLDEALTVTRTLLATLQHCHGYRVIHRDLKPENVVLRADRLADPVLVDFGMAWTKRDDVTDFATTDGQELGNRFLRLPEHAAGSHLEDPEDPRSDYTMLVGLLLYMLTGKAPRQLQDAQGILPHQRPDVAARLSAALRDDPRAPRLLSVFTIGFQPRVARRFQTADALRLHLDSLEPSPMTDDLDAELAQLNALLESEGGQEDARIEGILFSAGQHFYDEYMRAVYLIGDRGGPSMVSGGSHSVAVVDGARTLNFQFYLVKTNTSEPQASFALRVRAANGVFVGTVSYSFRVSETLETFYEGADVDEQGLMDALRDVAPRIVTRLLSIYRAKLQELHPPREDSKS